MLCYRCGSHVPDDGESCASCGQKLAGGGVRQATGTFSRQRPGQNVLEGAPYKPGETVAGRYRITDTVGAGPLGFVFRAHDTEVDVEVALKAINARLVQTPEERGAFARGIQGAKKLSNPHLVRAYEAGAEGERPFFTMQFLEGLTLRKIIDLRLAKGQFFALKEIEPILTQLASALEGAHKVGPHSDLKPENVIVLPDLLKVTDFGLGLAMPRLPFVQAMKAQRAHRYLSPELVEGGEIDGRADIYSLGVIMGEMLAGLTPDGAIPELVSRNPELPPAIEGLYRKALNQNPLARFKTPAEMLDAFLDLSRRLAPPPLKARVEPASNAPGRSKPHSSGNPPLQLLAKRPVEKPPPPVADEVLSDESEITTKNGKGQLLPLDATQPMDPAQIPGELALPPPSPQATAKGVADTVLSEPPELPTGETSAPGRSGSRSAALWLLLLTGAGLLTGALGGYLVLQRMRGGKLGERSAHHVQLDPVAPRPPPAPPPSQPEVESPIETAQEPSAERLLPAPKPDLSATASASLPGEAKDQPACPKGMRTVPAGSFKMGTSKDDPMMGFDERGLSAVELTAFCIDQYEYPNRRGATPTGSVSWQEARRLCEAKGKRLCSEEEWERACKGPGNARFPYGSGFDPEACNTEDEAGEDRTVAPAGRFARCRSGFGVWDLSGNLAEWTASPYEAGSDKTLKGGSFDRPDYAARCSARKAGAPAGKWAGVGFRCCSSLK